MALGAMPTRRLGLLGLLGTTLGVTPARRLGLLGTTLRVTPGGRLARVGPVTLWPGLLARMLEGRVALT
ncbi:hypothetical protein [Kribbella sp. NPDC023855]|uniref:hypothetical protein n=1 Tax=Kribbella sp. NPDC023855 TaxID=3154698 RepID=UPI0033DF4280